MGDPAYEAPMPAASYSNAKLFKVPLTKNYTHDVKAMVCADPHAGLMYLRNPNNPYRHDDDPRRHRAGARQ